MSTIQLPGVDKTTQTVAIVDGSGVQVTAFGGGAFSPTGAVTLAVSNVSARVALGSVGPTALVVNIGANVAYVQFGGSGVTATTANYPVPAGWGISFNVGSNTYIAAITASSTTNLTITTGTGVPSIVGGSGSSIANLGNNGVLGVDGATISTAANPFPVEIANGGTVAAVKAASTAPLATDPAAVVAISPNGQLAAGPAAGANSAPVVLATDYFPAGFTYKQIAAGQTTTVVKASAGVLHTITLNGAATATNVTTVYDNASGSGTVIAIPAATTATVPTTLTYDVAFLLGLTIITTTANGANMTIAYR